MATSQFCCTSSQIFNSFETLEALLKKKEKKRKEEEEGIYVEK